MKHETIMEEHWRKQVQEEKRKTLRLLAWLAFWIILFVVLHALT